ncbi:hypothetical protein MAPG_02825 [Magnaporthiopsis poae ATCC 64411]|uniref:Secreted protein n=1 Tax=Magnaporthiopsis poae (strain ATCC 64411 / 73-15) TaxID=644358 RepID=A0A0C4DSE6_MAGP6|nr:hypothetical protein MAPG_02825 [Magnaporthiopsis poae ATCC 64411]
MKFFAAVLALATVAVAAPSNPPNFVKDSVACACVNKAGVYAAGDICTKSGGWVTRDLPGGLCYPHTPSAADMTKAITDAYCKQEYGQYGWDKATCRPVKLCEMWPGEITFKDQWIECP